MSDSGSLNTADLAAWLNKTYPGRDWNQQCQRLVWNVVWRESGIAEGQMVTYPTATDARVASSIVSTDAAAAPVGAIHYWKNPAEGHVGVSLGGGSVLMTGTPYALGAGGTQLGANFGVTTVWAYNDRMANPYLGWAYANGANPTIVTSSEGEDDMFTDQDRALLKQTAQKADASYDALFKQSQTSRGEKAGVLSMTNALYDATFFEKETSRGTPAGVLGTLAVVLEQQALIMQHLGIKKAAE